MDDENRKLKDEVFRLRSEFLSFVSCTATVRQRNTLDWMAYITKKINEAMVVCNEPGQAEYVRNADSIVIREKAYKPDRNSGIPF